MLFYKVHNTYMHAKGKLVAKAKREVFTIGLLLIMLSGYFFSCNAPNQAIGSLLYLLSVLKIAGL